jgi:hypothetical protein
MATSVFNIVIVSALSIYFHILNKQADRGEKELETDEVSAVYRNVVCVCDANSLFLRTITSPVSATPSSVSNDKI